MLRRSIALFLILLTLPLLRAAPATAAPRPFADVVAHYPRLIRLAHNGAANGTLVASVNNPRGGVSGGDIFHSVDNGYTFTRVGEIRDEVARTGSCCATLYELPAAVGANPAGTLLWAASMDSHEGPQRRMRQRVWRSTDEGRTWSFLSTIDVAVNARGGWEPEFTIASSGELVVFYSDETDAAHGQKLVALRSSDGTHWTDKRDVVALPSPAKRPGMAVVQKVPDGRYLMAYEICSTDGTNRCDIYTRHSTDGWNWGDPASTGAKVLTAHGRYPAHTPTLAVTGNTVLLAYKRLRNADHTFASGDGRTILGNATNGTGRWFEIAAPVTVTDFTAPCANYSTPLLPTTDGKAVLQIAPTSPDCKALVGASVLAPLDDTSNREGGQLFVTDARPHYFGRSPVNTLRHWWLNTAGTISRDTWSSGIIGTPATFRYGEQQHAFARSTTGNLEHWWWTPDGGISHNTWGSDITDDPAVMVVGDAQHAWAVDTAGNLRHWWWTPSGGMHQDTWGSGVTGRPSVMLVDGVQHAFIRTASGQIRHWWWSRYVGLRSETIGAGLVADPVVTQIGDAQHVWAVDGAGNLRHWWWTPDQGWRADTWNTEGPGAAGRPAFLLVGDQQHIFARSDTGVLEQWRWSPSNGLVHNTWGTGVTITSDPTAVVVDGMQQVFATTADGVLHRWSWSTATGRQHTSWGS